MRVACLPLCAFFFALTMVLFLALLVHMTSDDRDEPKDNAALPPQESDEPNDKVPE
jgi:hypothetical protein